MFIPGSPGSAAADDPANTVTFRLTAPDADFLYKLAFVFTAPVPILTARSRTRTLDRCNAFRSASNASSGGLDDDRRVLALLVQATIRRHRASAARAASVCWDPTGTDLFAVERLAGVRAV